MKTGTITTFITIIIIGYLLSSFVQNTFDFSVWGIGYRAFVSVITLFLAFIISASIDYHDSN